MGKINKQQTYIIEIKEEDGKLINKVEFQTTNDIKAHLLLDGVQLKYPGKKVELKATFKHGILRGLKAQSFD